MKHKNPTRGFSLVELAVGIALLGLVLLAFAAITTVVQRSAGRTKQYSDAQQNARAALDDLTEQLRAAGADVAAYEGQQTLVNASPYQVAFNGDMDQGAVLNGQQPMTALDASQSPNTVPASGTPFYTPPKTFNSGAETVVLTLDSNGDGVVNSSDQGDDAEEGGPNSHLYVLDRYTYGKVAGATNTVRTEKMALVRGPVAYPNGDSPPPMFEYYYNDDNDLTTPDKLWGDSNNDGTLEQGEITSLTAMPDSLLYAVRMVKVNVIAEGNGISSGANDNQGFAHVVMSSRVYLRNVDGRDAGRIYGLVYLDANSNGTRDPGENGIPNVLVRIGNNGRKTTTDAYGAYNIPVGGGSYTIDETDLAGYTSTTSNQVAVTVLPGEKHKVDFGDVIGTQFGYITGKVWDDEDQSKTFDFGESPLPGVTVQLNNGMAVKTGPLGRYRFTVPVGSYTVTETDLDGYSSTTPNIVTASLASQGDSVVVNYGDIVGQATGTLAGHVYLDSDRDGQRDFGESGIPGVQVSLSDGSKTTTDTQGYYEFQLKPGKYDVYELDLDGYTSTTPNLVGNIWIAVDSLVTVDFGDAPIKDLEFVEIQVSDTDRPLSLAVGDLKEDNNRDPDIILGTPTSNTAGNIFFYINHWVDSSTPVSSLFNSTPDMVRNAGTDVNAIAAVDLSADLYTDVLSGQESYTGNNVLEWYNDRTGQVGTSPSASITSGSSSAVTRLRLDDVDKDGRTDIIVGQHSQLTPFSGGFEVLNQFAAGAYTSTQVETQNGAGSPLGIVSAVATGDLNNDGYPDLVVGSNEGDYWGHLDVFINDGTGKFVWKRRLLAKAGINAIAITDLMNDTKNLPDILVGVSVAQNVGGVQIWLNNGGGFGVKDTSPYVYDNDTDPDVPNDYYDAGGETLALATAHLDTDIYPEVLVGTRSSLFYTGDLLMVRDINGNRTVSNIKVNIAGEVVTIDFADFNKDNNEDVVVTTRTSATSGKLAIYFLSGSSVLP